MTRTSKPWTPQEDEILRENFPMRGALECAELLPGRTHYAIVTRCGTLGVRTDPKRLRVVRQQALLKCRDALIVWTPEADDALRRIYPTQGMEGALLAFPGRTRKSIKNRACQLRLRSPKNPHVLETTTEWFDMPCEQRVIPVGQWKAEIPAVRSVFDLAEAT